MLSPTKKGALPVRTKSCWSPLTWTPSTYRADRRPTRLARTTMEAEAPVYWKWPAFFGNIVVSMTCVLFSLAEKRKVYSVASTMLPNSRHPSEQEFSRRQHGHDRIIEFPNSERALGGRPSVTKGHRRSEGSRGNLHATYR